MFYMQFIGFLLLTASMHWLGGWGHLADGSGWQPWAWGFLAGLINACATLSLYRSFEIGKMAVVAPLSASYPALTLTLSWLSGDHLSPARSRSEEHTSELQSRRDLVCRLLLEKKKHTDAIADLILVQP